MREDLQALGQLAVALVPATRPCVPARAASAVEPAWADTAPGPVRALAHDALWAQELERQRIAAGLHDDIGQTLAMLGFKLGELSSLLTRPKGDGPANSAAATTSLLAELRSLVAQAASATRSATFELACPLLEPLGLPAALDSVARRIHQASQSGAAGPLHIQVQAAPDWPALVPPLPGVVYRVVRELLTNVQRHAAARQATVRLMTEGGLLCIEVQDDGRGFDPQAQARRRFSPQGGFGLAHVQAQVQAIGARLQLRSAPGQGCCASLLLPASAAALPLSPAVPMATTPPAA